MDARGAVLGGAVLAGAVVALGAEVGGEVGGGGDVGSVVGRERVEVDRRTAAAVQAGRGRPGDPWALNARTAIVTASRLRAAAAARRRSPPPSGR
jgi:hypothetical protein